MSEIRVSVKWTLVWASLAVREDRGVLLALRTGLSEL